MQNALLFSLLILPFLTACSPDRLAFSPEQAAGQAIMNSQPGVVVSPSSVKVLQRLNIAGKTVVLLSDNQRADGQDEQCIWLYEVQKTSLGFWISGNGGGGCQESQGDPEKAPAQVLQISGGMSKNGPNDPGICYAYGMVNQNDITRVRVTWNDGLVQEVPVMNFSYIHLRVGNYTTTRIEGLNQQGEVVYQSAPEIAPGKQ